MKEKVVIFGAGKKLYDHWDLFQKKEIAAILDNRIVSDPEFDAEIQSYIYPPSDIKKITNCPVYICSTYFSSIYKQLLCLGVEKERIQIFGLFKESRYWFERELSQYVEYITMEEDGVFVSVDDKIKYELDGTDSLINAVNYLKSVFQHKKDAMTDAIIHMNVKPIDSAFGTNRGTPVDRYYIEKFLKRSKRAVMGTCLEIAENTYTKKFGGNRVAKASVLHVNGGQNLLKGDLVTGEGISSDTYDCMIITQTLMFLASPKNAVATIYRGLKKGGTALITVSAITQISQYDAEHWGDYYRFNKDGVKELFCDTFGMDNIEIIPYGNVKIACALLYGVVIEELREEDFEYVDENYPVIYGIVARKQ